MLDHSERIMSYHDCDDAGFVNGLVLNADEGYAIGMRIHVDKTILAAITY